MKKEGSSRLELTSAYSVVGAPEGLAEEDIAAGGDLVERNRQGVTFASEKSPERKGDWICLSGGNGSYGVRFLGGDG
jgi:hypothetical protein